jgi:hypothetical protein
MGVRSVCHEPESVTTVAYGDLNRKVIPSEVISGETTGALLVLEIS